MKDKIPKILINENCQTLIDNLNKLSYKITDNKDLISNYDDEADMWRYALMTDMFTKKPKKSILWKLKNLLSRMLSMILARVKGCISGI